MAASSFMASNVAAPAGKMYESTFAAAAEYVECPEMYDGKFGRPITVLMEESSCDGRGLKYANFVSQQTTAASCRAMFIRASVRAMRTSLNPDCSRYGQAM